MAFNNAHHFIIEQANLAEVTMVDTQINNYNYNYIESRGEPLSPIRNVPPGTTRNFTGQENYLKRLHEHFDVNAGYTRKMFLLYGMGGIGKTQICLKFKDECSEIYSYIFWIDATTEDTLMQSFKDVYKTYNLNMPVGVSYSAEMVLQWIANLGANWLMIYDNADGSPEIVEKFLPSGDKGSILITSRNPEHKRVVSPINSMELAVMSEEVAVELLLKACGMSENPDRYNEVAKKITAKLHYLPLAIDQAGSYIAAGKCSIGKYLSLYDKYRHKLMNNSSFRGASKQEKTVYGTWEISYQKIVDMANDEDDEDNALAAKYAMKLIIISAFLHHENISDEIFERAAKLYTRNLEHYKDCIIPCILPGMDSCLLNLEDFNEWNEMQYMESIGILLSFSLIKRSADNAKFSLHPLVQTWCQDRLTMTERESSLQSSRGILISSVTDEEATSEHAYQNYLAVHALRNISFDNISEMTYYHDVFQIFADIFFTAGKSALEHKLRLRILDVTKETFGEEHPYTLTAIQNLAVAHVKLGRIEDALAIEINVVDIRTRVLGKENPTTLTSMADLATMYCSLGKCLEAERLESEILGVRKRILGEDHLDTIISMGNLGTTYRVMGKFVEAENLETQVLEMRTRILGKDNPQTLISMGNLANTYRELGKYIEAEMLELKALEMRVQIQGKEHPDTLTSMANLARTYAALGECAKAETLETQVLEMRTRVLGNEHPDTLISMSNLARTFRDTGNYAGAEKLNVQALEMRSRLLGIEHPDTLVSMNTLADTYKAQGKYIEAEKLEIDALEKRTRIQGEKHCGDRVPPTLELATNTSFHGLTFTAVEKIENTSSPGQ